MQATLERLRQRREERGDEGGFTLIELLIVIVILGILAAIVVFAVQNLSGKSAAAACSSDYKTAETAIEAYKAQVGHYPTAANISALNTELLSTTNAAGGPWIKDALPTATTNGGKYYLGYTAGTNASIQVFKAGSTVATSAGCAGVA